MMTKGQRFVLFVLEVILLVYCYLAPNPTSLMLFLTAHLHIVINRKAYHIKGFWGAIFLRRTLYFIPYVLPVLYFPEFVFHTKHSSDLPMYVLIALCIGAVISALRIKEIKPFYNRQFVQLLPPVSMRQALLEAYSFFGSAIFEELFYKGFLLTLLMSQIGVFASIVIMGLIFIADHFCHYSAPTVYKPIDYVFQFCEGCITGILYLKSGSLLIPVLVHSTYNAPIAFSYFARWYFSKSEGKVTAC